MGGLSKFERRSSFDWAVTAQRISSSMSTMPPNILLRDIQRQTEKLKVAMDACLKVLCGEAHPSSNCRAMALRCGCTRSTDSKVRLRSVKRSLSAGIRHSHHATTYPPSTINSWPVMPLAASDARNATASATSLGAISLRIGTSASHWLMISGLVFPTTPSSSVSV